MENHAERNVLFNQQSAINHFPRCCSQLYLSFNVVSANNAKISDAIQKRTITFDSDQPSSSK